MTDIVERLREGGCGDYCDALGHEAADEIERLRAERDSIEAEYQQACTDLGVLTAEIVALLADAERWRLFVRTASLGFDASPSWNAVIRFPVFNSDNQTITALVDSAREALKAEQPPAQGDKI